MSASLASCATFLFKIKADQVELLDLNTAWGLVLFSGWFTGQCRGWGKLHFVAYSLKQSKKQFVLLIEA